MKCRSGLDRRCRPSAESAQARHKSAGSHGLRPAVTARVALPMLCLLALAGCSSHDAARSDAAGNAGRSAAIGQCIDSAVESTDDTQNYRIAPGDQLAISFYLSPEFNQDVTVRADGVVALHLVGEARAAGLTPVELSGVLDKAYAHELVAPKASVKVTNSPGRRIYVEGQVSHPGAFPLQPGMTAVQAVAEAGGLTEEAAGQAVLIRRDSCGLPHGSSFDLGGALTEKDSREDMALLPADVVVVPRSRIADINLFMKQYIKNMIPVDPYLPLIP